MFCRACSGLFWSVYGTSRLNAVRSLTGRNVSERDPAPLFFNSFVQQLLKKLTRLDIKTVFRTGRYGEKLRAPQYKFLTTEELNKVIKDAEKKAEQKLQMPPVILKCSEELEILSQDYEIERHSEAKFVCTDITFGRSDRERTIVVRETNGVLRKALPDERHRMNETYFPQPGRNLRTPKMFEEDHLKRLLNETKYEFLLDRACLQFEPDDPKYQSIVTRTYQAVDEAQHYDLLRSTRHFGPFVFHLAWTKRIDSLLLDLIQTDRLDEAVALVELFYMINTDVELETPKLESGQEHKYLEAYVKLHSSKRNVLELTLKASEELHKERQLVDEGIRRSHGHI